jgi:hypothetical protein
MLWKILIILFAAHELAPLTNGGEGANDSPCSDTTNNEKLPSVEIERGMDVDNVKDSQILAAGAVTSSKADANEKSAEIEQEMGAAATSSKVDNHEKSAEIEHKMDVESSTTAGIATSPEAVDTSLPQWLLKILPYLRNVSDFKDWQDLVAAFVEFEKLDPPTGVRVFG